MSIKGPIRTLAYWPKCLKCLWTYFARYVPREGLYRVLPLTSFEHCDQISIHLEPYDLLNLARSTRVLNGWLMSRESRPIWRMARTYYPGLPECPSDLSEPAYARLLFETDCCHVGCLCPTTFNRRAGALAFFYT